MEEKQNVKTKIEFVGTLRDSPFPKLTGEMAFLNDELEDPAPEICNCPQCQDFDFIERKGSALLVNDDVMVNIGGFPDTMYVTAAEIFINRYDDLRGIVFTSPRYMRGVLDMKKNLLTKPAHVIEHIPHDFNSMYNERLFAWFDAIHSYQYNQEFNLGGTSLEFISIFDSRFTRIAGLKIDGHILYTPDFVTSHANMNQIFDGVDTWITDGRSLSMDVKDEHYPDGAEIEHMSMFNQLRLAGSHQVPAVVFTHIGHIGKTLERLDKDLTRFVGQHVPNVVSVEVVKNGDVYSNVEETIIEEGDVLE